MAQVHVLKAAIKGEWEAILTLYRERPTLCDAAPVTVVTGNTLVHIAVQSDQDKVVGELLDLLPEHTRLAKNKRGNTSLHEAARAGKVETAEMILKKDENLILSRNDRGEMPVFWAAMYGKKEMLIFLVSVAKKFGDTILRRNDGATILHAAALGEFYDLALEILEMFPKIAFSRDERGMTALHLLAFSSTSFKSRTVFDTYSLGSPTLAGEKIAAALYACIPMKPYRTSGSSNSLKGSDEGDFRKFSFIEICNACPVLGSIYIEKQKHKWALQFAKHLIEKESQWNYEHDGQDPQRSYGKKLERPLILATKFGIVELVDEIVKAFPESVEFLDEAGKNLLHLAVKHRQEYVFRLLKKMKGATTVMAAGIDTDGNTILHLAAKLGEDKPSHVRGAAFHLQWEGVWFERVKKLCPSHLVPLRNSSNQTAKEVFTQSHKDLLEEGKKLSKEVSQTTMLVSTLIATITFAGVFTVPGGNDQTELPILRHDTNFTLFAICISASLFFSMFSLATCISIYTSPFEEKDFLAWLPFQSVVAATTLFNSVLFAAAAFMISFFLVTNGSYPVLMTIVGTTSAGFFFFTPVYFNIVSVPISYLIDLLFISNDG
ncbi:ankyrin repeat-containing protein NPR4-like isoform X2 [Magnolia sinica]|uniref:ankyrin repeat-containing protein NPR4-like isoform X2 n=1 Tax=Magnolia sinica TaxID=86752 RepID=UPI002658723C|nr:ankyrin repeat-containing protein NPR4-like isoform X2 [Magnolia sinica]